MLRSILLLVTLLGASATHASESNSGPQPCAIAIPKASHSGDQPPLINHGPQVPDLISKPKEVIPLGCERPFTFHGQTYSADTPQAQDASQLKSFVQDVPEAKDIMEQYQSNRNKSKISAYTGTAGIAIFLLANIVATRFESNAQSSIRSAMTIGGASLAAGGFLYSFALLRTNEFLIPNAVDAYNKAKPNDPIVLQFTTSWGF